jgi:hypothetical protein
MLQTIIIIVIVAFIATDIRMRAIRNFILACSFIMAVAIGSYFAYDDYQSKLVVPVESQADLAAEYAKKEAALDAEYLAQETAACTDKTQAANAAWTEAELNCIATIKRPSRQGWLDAKNNK